MSWTSVLRGWVLLCLLGLPSLLAAETRYIASGRSPLTVRRGPGVEYEAVSRLPHGTEVLLHEYWGQWVRVTVPDQNLTGWVQEQYLSSDPPETSEDQIEMDPEQELRRFTRLQRKGVIVVQRSNVPGVVRLTINPLIWHRLTPHEQENFLRRAQQNFNGTVVELYDRRNDILLARLTALGDVEFMTPPPDAELPADDDIMPPFSPAPFPDLNQPSPQERP